MISRWLNFVRLQGSTVRMPIRQWKVLISRIQHFWRCSIIYDLRYLYLCFQNMKRRKRISYNELQEINEVIRLDSVFCLPVFREWISTEQTDKLIWESFIEVWKSNWDWYFLNPVNHKYCQEVIWVYFSKIPLRNTIYDILDYLPGLKIYMFTRKIKHA